MDEIERRIAREDWNGARELMSAALCEKPDDHWLLTRLALTYYEQRNYAEALRLSEEALQLVPRCPLVLWDYAGALEMLDRPVEALVVYRRLIRRGPRRIATGHCGEGLARARGLVADCMYRAAQCHAALEEVDEALRMYERHLSARGPGCHSIYGFPEVKKRVAALRRATRVRST
jgi:tetratricopeptide (TPR) repeat protein